jgi:hypothetical protein
MLVIPRHRLLFGWRRSGPDLAQFDELEAERFDLRKDAEHRGPILKQAGKHGLAARQLRHHGGEGGQSSSSEPTPYPDRVPAGRCNHAAIVQPELVRRRRRNLVIVRMPTARYFGDVGESRFERSRSWRAR